MDKEAIEEARYLRKDISIIENSTIKLYNHFMTFVQAQLPYKLDHTIFMENFEGDTPFSQRAECPIEEKKQTAKYDENDKFMFPLGRLRFCEFDIVSKKSKIYIIKEFSNLFFSHQTLCMRSKTAECRSLQKRIRDCTLKILNICQLNHQNPCFVVQTLVRTLV